MNAKTRIAAAAALAGALCLTACTPSESDGGGGQSGPLTVWTLERQPERVEVQKQIAADFTKASGVDVEIVAVDEAQYSQLLVSSAASGDLPDVIGGLGLPGVGALDANELLDREAAARVVEALGRDTFAARSLELAATPDGQQLAVPSDSWASVLLYRKDLFDKAGLKAPETYGDILTAAQALTADGRVGFSGFTTNQETFEHRALGNGCQLVEDSGEVALDSPPCEESFEFYRELMTRYSVPGEQDTNTARANYLSGRSAMVMFSSFILDEAAGLRKDMLPSCQECAGDPSYLAKNSGVVTAIKGPDGEPARFGSQVNWAIPVEAGPAAADFVEYMMSEGYERWLAFAPEGKVPARQGTKDSPTAYVDAWKKLPSGVSTKAPLSDFYPQSVVDELTSSPEEMTLWAVPQGRGALAGAILAEQPVAKAINSMVTGGTSARDAATSAADAVRGIQSTLK